MEIWISLIAIIISILSLCLSFLQNRNTKIGMHKIEIKNSRDSFELLFNENNKINIGLVNYNDRDILLYLKAGYVEIDNREHLVASAYYTARSTSVTDIQIEILPSTQPHTNKKEKLYLLFQYKGLLFNVNCKVRINDKN